MKRAIVVALGTGTIISSAAALGIGAVAGPAQQALTRAGYGEVVRLADIEDSYRRSRESSRALQRAHIETRYLVDRAKCLEQGGLKRDNCLVATHAAKGRALLEAAAPYANRL
jgi:hypothetical protein